MREVKKTGWDLKEVQMAANASISSVKNGFVGTGYYLGIIRSEKLWKEDGSESFDEYMNKNYQRDKSWASKCISVYDQFGEPIQPGEKPRLRAEYQEYNVSQLFELIYLPEEKREEVTPKTPVKAIRELKPKKEKKVSTVETIEPEKLSAYGTSIKVYPADSLIAMPGCEGGHDCFMCHLQCGIRQEYCRCVEATTGNPFPCEQIDRIDTLREEIGERCQFVNLDQAYHRAGDHEPVPCCKECKEPCQYACERSIKKREAEEKTPEPQPRAWNIYATPCIHRDGFSCTVPEDKKNVPGDGSNCNGSCCWECTRHGNCKLECNCSASRPEEPEPEPVQSEPDPVIDAKYEEVPEQPEPENEKLTDLEIVRKMLEKENKLLESCLLAVPDRTDIHIRRMSLKVAALAAFECDLDNIENPAPKPEQPELPLLKNNDQRAAFVDAYETWPLWIETAETGERYYRYDLPDGTSMVVKVYHARIFEGYMAGSYESRYHEGYGMHEYYLLKPGKFFRDCESNRSTLIDKLKEIQKKEKA